MKSPEFDAKEFVASLPRRPGVYRMYNSDHEILYIGKAKNLKDRVGSYFAASNVNPKVQALVGLIVEPYLRQEYSEQSEQDREADHDEGTGAHATSPE